MAIAALQLCCDLHLLADQGQISLSWRYAFIRLKHYMPRLFLTHSSLSMNIVIWLNWFHLQISLKHTFSSPLFRPSSFSVLLQSFLIYPFLTQESCQTATRITFLKSNSNPGTASSQPWVGRQLFIVDQRLSSSGHSPPLCPLLPGQATGVLTLWSSSSHSVSFGILAHKILVMTQRVFSSNALFDLV